MSGSRRNRAHSWVFAIIAAAGIIAPPSSAAAEADAIGKGVFGLGLNYPGAGVRYFLTDHFPLELKAQVAEDVVLGGLRAYRYFRPLAGIYPLVGLEADYVAFKGDRAKGSGFAGQVFVGGERFLTRRLSMQLDFGPAYIHLPNKADASSVSGLEYVINFGLNFYLGGGRSTDTGYSATPADPWPGWAAEEEPAPKPRRRSKAKAKPKAKASSLYE